MRAAPKSTVLLAVPCLLAACSSRPEARLEGPLHEYSHAAWEHAVAPAPPDVGEPGPAADELAPAEAAPAFPAVIDDGAVYSLQLRDAELGQALHLVAEMAGLNLMLAGDFSERVDLSLPAVRLQTALETLARTHGCTVEAEGEVLILRRDDRSSVQTRVFELQSASAASLEAQLAGIVGPESVVVNPTRNVVMVSAPAARLDDVARFLVAVDRPERQVLIEARIIEVSREALEELGARIRYDDISVDSWTATFVSDLLTSNTKVLATASNADGSIDYAINAIQSLDGLDVLSRPRLLALDGHEARLDIVSEVPYVNATTTTEGTGTTVGVQTLQEVEFKNVGLQLTVTPTIQADGLISLAVQQELSEQTGSFLDIPVVDSRQLATTFIVKEGETIMIGGIMKDRRQETTEGVPLLKDVPWLGRLFRSDVDDRSALELVVLMTPRLIDPRRAWSPAATEPVHFVDPGDEDAGA